MKKLYKSLLLLLGLLLTFFLVPTGLNVISNVRASGSDYDYTFTNDIFYNDTSPVYDESFNIRNQQEFTGNYNATYSFTDDDIGEVPNGWVNSSNFGSNVYVIDSINGHEKILQLNDPVGSSIAQARLDFGQIFTNIEFEFWLTKNSTSSGSVIRMYLREDTDIITYFIWDNDDFDYSNGSIYSIKDNFLIVNIFTHFKFIVNDTLNTFDCYINGILEGSGLGYFNNSTLGVNNFIIETDSSDFGYKGYLDAIGIEGVNYSIGDNLIPLIEELETNEVDRWEFALADKNELNAVDSDDPNGWQDYEESGDIVNIKADSTNDRLVYMYSGTYNNGLFKNDFIEEDSQIVEIKWKFQYYAAETGLCGNTTLHVYSNDSTEIVRINVFNFNGDNSHILQYFDGSNYVNLSINDAWLNGYIDYDFYLYVNYYDDIAFLSYQNSTDYRQYYFPLIESGKDGINQVRFINYEHVSTVINLPINFDYIGVYCDALSQSDEWAWKSVDLPVNWDIRDNNLLYGDYIGWGNISVCNASYSVGVSDFYDLFDLFYYYSDTDILNIHDKYSAIIIDPYLLFYQVNYYDDPYISWWDVRNFNVENFSINGVKLVEGVNEFDLVYTTVNNHPEQVYFYVDNSYLRYTLTCSDSDLEYISANFDIDDFPTNEYAIGFSADIEGYPFLYCLGVLYLNFGDATSYGYYFDSNEAFRVIMTQNKTISDITITISDNDVDGASGNTVSGYVSSLEFIYYSNVETTLTMIGLLAMIGPLLALFIPALLLYSKYGKRVFMPVLLLMSIVCVVTSLIPYWLFFLMMIFFGVYFFYSYKKGDIV